jgi:DNA-binding transcriptional MerR regulator
MTGARQLSGGLGVERARIVRERGLRVRAPVVDHDLDLVRLDAVQRGPRDVRGIDHRSVEQGLLSAQRTPSGQRRYADAAVDRVQLIQQLYAAGLASRTILELLPCVDAKVNTPESRVLLATERDRIDRQIAGLQQTRNRLDAVITATRRPDNGCTWAEG